MEGVGKIPNIRTISSYRGEVLIIDLGKEFLGYLSAYMLKRDDSEYREFEIVDNRYLKLSRDKSLDYYKNGELVQKIEGVWNFDVKSYSDELLSDIEAKTIYRGTIKFENNITGDTSYDLELETVY